MRLRLIALTFALAVAHSSAAAIDLHEFWDSRCHECHECHGHAGAFARQNLSVEDGALVGRHHKNDLKRFLGQHEMGPANVEGIYAMLIAQATTPPLFQQKCSGCHQTAAEFVRKSIVQKDGVVLGRSNQKPIAEFLQKHGGLNGDEVATVVETLTRVFGEVQRSPSK